VGLGGGVMEFARSPVLPHQVGNTVFGRAVRREETKDERRISLSGWLRTLTAAMVVCDTGSDGPPLILFFGVSARRTANSVVASTPPKRTRSRTGESVGCVFSCCAIVNSSSKGGTARLLFESRTAPVAYRSRKGCSISLAKKRRFSRPAGRSQYTGAGSGFVVRSLPRAC